MRRPHDRPGHLVLALALLSLLASGLLAIPVTAQTGSGIGVAPSTLRIDDPPLVRGGTMERTLSFQQHDYDRAEVEIRVLSPTDASNDASGWVTADPSGSVTVARTSDYPVTVHIEVPADAANGEYRAKVEFRVIQACDSGGSCAAVQTAASSILVMTVGGDEVKRVKVTGSPTVRDVEEGGTLQFTVPMENIGNVVADPHVRFDVQDKFEKEVLATYWFNGTRLSPGEGRGVTFTRTPVDLAKDQYWGIVSVYLGDTLITKSNPQAFDVVSPGSLSRSAELKTIRVDGDRTTAKVGDLIKLSAVVQNTGQAPILARFKGEVHVDGALRDTFESDPLEIPMGETALLEMIYRVAHEGQHEFKGRVSYGSQQLQDKVTAERSLLLRVEGGSAGNALFVWLGGAAVLVLLAVLAVVFLLRTKQDSKRQRRAPPAKRRGPSQRGRAGRPPQGRPPGGRPPSGGPQRPPGSPPQGRSPQGRSPPGAPPTRRPPSGPPQGQRRPGRPPERR